MHCTALADKATEARSGKLPALNTLASLEYGWRQGREPLGPRAFLVIDEGGMVGSRQLGHVLEVAQEVGA